MPSAPTLARLQGWYYLLSGIWPLVHGGSFQALTGEKADFWLAQVVGALLALTGIVLLQSARARPAVPPEVRTLAAGSALILGVADLLCVALPRTTPAYWADAVLEFGLVALWIALARQHRRA